MLKVCRTIPSVKHVIQHESLFSSKHAALIPKAKCQCPCNLKEFHSSPLQTGKLGNMYRSVRRKLGVPSLEYIRDDVKNNSYWMYEDFADRINYSQFFELCKLPDTFQSWYLVTELHMWMLMVRLQPERDEGLLARDVLVRAMWEDIDKRATKLSGGSVDKKTEYMNIFEQMRASILIYDDGLCGSDTILANALCLRLLNHIFLKEMQGVPVKESQNFDPRILEVLIKYVRENIEMLDNINRERILTKAQIIWLPLRTNILQQSSHKS